MIFPLLYMHHIFQPNRIKDQHLRNCDICAKSSKVNLHVLLMLIGQSSFRNRQESGINIDILFCRRLEVRYVPFRCTPFLRFLLRNLY